MLNLVAVGQSNENIGGGNSRRLEIRGLAALPFHRRELSEPILQVPQYILVGYR